MYSCNIGVFTTTGIPYHSWWFLQPSNEEPWCWHIAPRGTRQNSSSEWLFVYRFTCWVLLFFPLHCLVFIFGLPTVCMKRPLKKIYIEMCIFSAKFILYRIQVIFAGSKYWFIFFTNEYNSINVLQFIVIFFSSTHVRGKYISQLIRFSRTCDL